MGISRAVCGACNNPYSVGMFRYFLFGPTLQFTAATRRLHLDSREFKFIWKYTFTLFSLSFLDYSTCFFLSKYEPTILESNLGGRFGERKEKIEKLLLSIPVIHTTTKQVISRYMDQNGGEMYRNEKCTRAKGAKLPVLFHLVKYANLCRRGCASILTVNQERRAIGRWT